MKNYKYTRLRFIEAPEGDPTGGATDPIVSGYTPPATQADFDRIISERVSRAKSKFGDYDDLKAKATRLGEIEAANATDLEKAIAAARAETTTEITGRTNARLAAAEIRAIAAELHFRDATDAIANFGDLATVKFGDDGEIDGAAIRARLEEVAKAKSYLLVDTKTPVVPAGQAGIGVTSSTAAQVTPGMGRLQHAYASSPSK